MASPSRTTPPPPARGAAVAMLVVAVCLVAAMTAVVMHLKAPLAVLPGAASSTAGS